MKKKVAAPAKGSKSRTSTRVKTEQALNEIQGILAGKVFETQDEISMELQSVLQKKYGIVSA